MKGRYKGIKWRSVKFEGECYLLLLKAQRVFRLELPVSKKLIKEIIDQQLENPY